MPAPPAVAIRALRVPDDATFALYAQGDLSSTTYLFGAAWNRREQMADAGSTRTQGANNQRERPIWKCDHTEEPGENTGAKRVSALPYRSGTPIFRRAGNTFPRRGRAR